VHKSEVARTQLFGLLDQKPRWGFSLKGWVVFGLLTFSLAFTAAWTAYPFLAVSHPLPSDTLVVEGWVPRPVISRAAEEVRAGHYAHVFTTGGPVSGSGPYRNEYHTSAHVAYTRLLADGISTNVLHKVPCRVRDRDRTYSAAVALRVWFNEHDYHPKSVNVMTESVHARRSRLLFEKALGPAVEVGILAVPSDDYPAEQWWKYSAGVKEVISEGAAYLYARLFFWPSGD